MRWPFRRKALSASPEVLEALGSGQWQTTPILGGTNLATERIRSIFVKAQSSAYGYMYQTQPAVRAAVDYVARNVAQLDLVVYRRITKDQREPVDDHAATALFSQPNGFTPGAQWVFNMLADFLIYDDAFSIKFRPPVEGGDLKLVYVPSSAVGILGDTLFQPVGYRFFRSDGSFFDMATEDVLHWRGYNPTDPRGGFSKLETLRQELATDAAARQAKTELDQSGLTPRGWVERPVDAPEWSPEAQSRFREGWSNWARESTARTPVLEDGMHFKQSTISPEDAQMLQARQFTRSEVNAAYGLQNVPPETEEERYQVYCDVLPPYCQMFCSYLNMSILADEYQEPDLYAEFDLDEKLMGEERLKTLVSVGGGPYMTRNEVRARVNLPPLPDHDVLVTPLNIVEGDNPKPSVDVMPVQNPIGPPQDGSHRPELPAASKGFSAELPVPPTNDMTALIADRLRRTYERWERSYVMTRKIDEQRYTKELGNDLAALVQVNRGELDEAVGGLHEAIGKALDGGFGAGQVFGQAQAHSEQLAAHLVAQLGLEVPALSPEALRQLGVPDEIVWERAGFSEEEIDRMRALRLASELSVAGDSG